MIKVIYGVVLVATLTIFGSCSKSYEEKQRINRKQLQELARKDSLAFKIATTPTMDCLPIFIGIDDSLFHAAGVDVRIRDRASQLDGDTLVAGGHVQGFVTDLIRAERLRKQGTPLRYVAATNAYWQIISNRLSRVKDFNQMSDKMIAMTRYSTTEFFINLISDSVKTKHEVYKIQINDVNIRAKMLLNNEIDAAVLTEPQATEARIKKNPVLMDSRNKNYSMGVIAFREADLKHKERSKQLKAFLEVYNNICDSINRNGLAHYSVVIKKHMHVDAKTIGALPKLKYTHATAPRARDVERAKAYWK